MNYTFLSQAVCTVILMPGHKNSKNAIVNLFCQNCIILQSSLWGQVSIEEFFLSFKKSECVQKTAVLISDLQYPFKQNKFLYSIWYIIRHYRNWITSMIVAHVPTNVFNILKIRSILYTIPGNQYQYLGTSVCDQPKCLSHMWRLSSIRPMWSSWPWGCWWRGTVLRYYNGYHRVWACSDVSSTLFCSSTRCPHQ